MTKNILEIVLILSILLIFISNCTAAENEFGTVSAYFNEESATVEGIVLKINEPFTVKATIESKIDGNIYVRLSEPGVTNAYEVIEGPSEIDEFIDNLKIESGWKNTYIWKLKPNGDWTNGNAPLNLLVQFNQAHDDIRKIQFTIANPYILDEHYSGPTPTQTATDPSSTDQPPGSNGLPGFGVVGAVIVIMLAVRYRFGKV
ncbi:MAG: sarcinarray family MAST domain-containing protein [Methanosarcinales archaeon]|nr:sarcinarray family MAST domain-containing protein [Methanosarcinales archaeon]